MQLGEIQMWKSFGGQTLDCTCFPASTLTLCVCLLLSDDRYDISLSGTSELARLRLTCHCCNWDSSLPVCLSVFSSICLSVSASFHPSTPHTLHLLLCTDFKRPVIVLLLNVNKVWRQCAPPSYSTAYFIWIVQMKTNTINNTINFFECLTLTNMIFYPFY